MTGHFTESINYGIIVSEGIANSHEHVAGADRPVQLADQALYRAKSAGHDQVYVAEPISGRASTL